MVNLDARVSFRCSSKTRSDYEEMCAKYDRDPGDFNREMMDAFSEGRLTIAVPKDKVTLMKGVHIVDRK